MKASEFIKQLQEIIEKHGDIDLYYDYDDGVRQEIYSVSYVENVPKNEHSEHWGTLKRGAITNYSREL